MENNNVDKAKQEKKTEEKFLNEFNSITNKEKVENQNQNHNSRKEGINPINQRR